MTINLNRIKGKNFIGMKFLDIKVNKVVFKNFYLLSIIGFESKTVTV